MTPLVRLHALPLVLVLRLISPAIHFVEDSVIASILLAPLLPIAAASIAGFVAAPSAYAEAKEGSCPEVSVGATLNDATIQDASKHSAQIPDLGKKVLLILYTDPDVADQNDPFSDQVNALAMDKMHFRSVGIANMEDAPAKPNWIMRSIIRARSKSTTSPSSLTSTVRCRGNGSSANATRSRW